MTGSRQKMRMLGLKKAARFWLVGVLLCLWVSTSACGGGKSVSSQTGPLSGNWQIELVRHANPGLPQIFTGFLTQSGNSIAGSLIFLNAPNSTPGCLGVGPITGTVSGGNVSLTINEFGEDLSLAGTLPSGTGPMTGEFSNLAGGCTAFPNTGNWTAVQVAPVNGSFHGAFTSAAGNGILDVTGNISQGPNTGSSTATLSGSITASGGTRFCSYLSTATIGGLVSGTTVTLSLYGPDGSLITQIGQLNNPQAATASVTPDGTSLSGSYNFPTISTSCLGDSGSFQITFP